MLPSHFFCTSIKARRFCDEAVIRMTWGVPEKPFRIKQMTGSLLKSMRQSKGFTQEELGEGTCKPQKLYKDAF